MTQNQSSPQRFSVDEYLALKRQVTNLQSAADKMMGALELMRKQLKDEFGCDNLKEARQLLSKLEKEEAELSSRFQESLNKFKQDYDHVLQEVDH